MYCRLSCGSRSTHDWRATNKSTSSTRSSAFPTKSRSKDRGRSKKPLLLSTLGRNRGARQTFKQKTSNSVYAHTGNETLSVVFEMLRPGLNSDLVWISLLTLTCVVKKRTKKGIFLSYDVMTKYQLTNTITQLHKNDNPIQATARQRARIVATSLQRRVLISKKIDQNNCGHESNHLICTQCFHHDFWRVLFSSLESC